MATITLSDGRKLTETNDRDARGNQVLRGADGSLYTSQGGRIVLSRPGPGSSPTTSNIDTGSPELDEFAQTLEAQLRQFVGDGQTSISDTIEITPEKAQEFVDQALKELDPFYQNQFKSFRKDFEESVVDLQATFEANVGSVTSQVRPALRTFRDQLGERGLAQSGQRVRGENQLVSAAQRSLDSLTRGVQSTARKSIRTTERNIGSRNLEGLAVPNLNVTNFANFRPGETALRDVQGQATTTPLFELSEDVTGRLEEEREKNLRLRGSELETAFRGQEARRLFNT